MRMQLAARSGLTPNQAKVLKALTDREEPAGAYDLLDSLRDAGFRAPLQVYRALDKLIERGLVHRLESLNAFVACACSHDHGHGVTAFAICENCKRVDEFADEVIEGRMADWAHASGFHLTNVVIELRGTCENCHRISHQQTVVPD